MRIAISRRRQDRIEAGILLSLSREVSTKLVVQTMLGTVPRNAISAAMERSKDLAREDG
jgi:pyrroline-5-carboxylate reductase